MIRRVNRRIYVVGFTLRTTSTKAQVMEQVIAKLHRQVGEILQISVMRSVTKRGDDE